jgi:hypothetical protein
MAGAQGGSGARADGHGRPVCRCALVALFSLVALGLGACEGLHSQTMHPGARDAAPPDAATIDGSAGDVSHDLALDIGADADAADPDAAATDATVILEDGAFATSIDLAMDPDAATSGDDAAAPDASDPEPDPDPMATPLMIVIAPAAPVRMVDESVAFTASLLASDGSTRDIGDRVVWASSRPAVARIESDGVATAVSVGVTEISARLGGLVGVESFTVAAPTIRRVLVTPTTATIAAGDTQAFTATVVFTTGDTFDATEAVLWTSSRGDVATVSLVPGSSGTAVGKAPGETEIGFELLGFSARARLTVTR